MSPMNVEPNQNAKKTFMADARQHASKVKASVSVIYAVGLLLLAVAFCITAIVNFMKITASGNIVLGMVNGALAAVQGFGAGVFIYAAVLCFSRKATPHVVIYFVSNVMTAQALLLTLSYCIAASLGGGSVVIVLVSGIIDVVLYGVNAVLSYRGIKPYAQGALIYALIVFIVVSFIQFIALAFFAFSYIGIFSLVGLILFAVATGMALPSASQPASSSNQVLNHNTNVYSGSWQVGTSSNPRTKKSDADTLKELKSLLDAGIITQEEFNAKKEEILRRMGSNARIFLIRSES